MSRFDRFLAGTFPEYAMRRIKARKMSAAYETSKTTRTFNRKAEVRGPNSAARGAPKNVRDQIRYLEQNNDIVSGALDTMVANIVGNGIQPEPQILDRDGLPIPEINDLVSKWWQVWCKRPEVTWTMDEGAAQRLTARTWLRDGEVLLQHIMGNRARLSHGSEMVPYSYELIEPDFLPDEYENGAVLTARGKNNRVIAGVELNAWNRPVWYHVFKQHPNDHDFRQAVGVGLTNETKAISAADVSHLKMVTRIGQVRGVSRFSTVIKRLADIQEIEESERVAARIAAAFSAVIVKGTPDLYNPDSETGDRNINIAPGMIIDDLEQGERMESLASNRPNNELIPFRAAQLRATAAGIGISYSSLSKDYNGTYSAQRQELVEQRQIYTPTWAYFVAQSEVPKYRRFINSLRLSGLLSITPDVDEDTLFDAVYSQPAMPWIDPKKEADGWVSLLDAGLETKSSVIRQRGKDPRQVFKQLELEMMMQPQPEQAEDDAPQEIAPPDGPVEALTDGFYQRGDGLVIEVDSGVPTRQFGSLTDAVRFRQKVS